MAEEQKQPQNGQEQLVSEPEVKRSLEEDSAAKFRIYVKLPKILFICTLVIYFIWAVVDAAAFTRENGTIYGVMGLSNAFLCWLVWMLIGFVNGIILYYSLKIPMSYRILHLLYLQKLLNANKQPFVPIEKKPTSEEKTA